MRPASSLSDAGNNGACCFDGIWCDERKAIRQARGDSEPARDPVGDFFGLAFSGGGIRSATFNLGIVQALVDLNLLRRVDYLSVVSGGGYIGACISALIQRRKEEADSRGEAWSVSDLQDDLGTKNPANKEGPLGFLRRYSNYLTPRYGLFSVDTLAAVANLHRNMILNQAIFVALLVMVLLLPRIVAGWIDGMSTEAGSHLPPLAILLLAVAAATIGLGLAGLPQPKADDAANAIGSKGIAGFAVVPGFTACLLLAVWISTRLNDPRQSFPGGIYDHIALGAVGYVLLFLVIFLFVWTLGADVRSETNEARGLCERICGAATDLLFAALAGAFGGGMLWAYAKAACWAGGHGAWFAAGPGASLMLGLLALTISLHIGLAKRRFSEEAREWFGRVGGMALGLGMAWLFVSAVVILGPALFDVGGRWLTYGGGLAWVLTTVGGLAAGYSSATGAQKEKGEHRGAELMAKIAPYVFVIGLLGLLALGIAAGLDAVNGQQEQTADCATQASCTTAAAQGAGETRESDLSIDALCRSVALRLGQAERQWKASAQNGYLMSGQNVYLMFVAALFVALLLSVRVDVNLFSMHQFYRNRLARAYLGASRGGRRKPDPFTDFDPNDDLPLAKLDGQRPYLLINAALNITDGSHVEWQQRQATPFVFSPRCCGFALPGGTEAFRPTAGYLWREKIGARESGRGGVLLGNAMAVSGAAANPNAGYTSSPVTSFLLALFNVRLGRWCGNPAHRKTWEDSSPDFGLRYLIQELFGVVNESSPFVNLSDGGHFENLGIYELVRRRCRIIVACDAGQDDKFQFEDLGNAVRKCRIDFGAEIDIDTRAMAATDPAARPRAVVGRIAYADGTHGVLVYLKPLLRQDEPADILHYAATHATFPHESTGDQWFDEAQFESYRKLGWRTGMEVFGWGTWGHSVASASQWVDAVADSLQVLAPLGATRAARTEAA